MSKDLELRVALEDLETAIKNIEETISELDKNDLDQTKEEMYVKLAGKQVYLFYLFLK